MQDTSNIENKDALIAELRAKISEQSTKISEQDSKIASLESELSWLRKKVFGKMSEKKLPVNPMEEPTLFDEAISESESLEIENHINIMSRPIYVDLTFPKNVDFKFAYYKRWNRGARCRLSYAYKKREPNIFRLSLKGWRLPTLPLGIAVPSALTGLTSLFGMGRGGSPSLLPPLFICHLSRYFLPQRIC